MGMSMAGGGASGPEMNVTPLIDVLLVLIIIFMIVANTSHCINPVSKIIPCT